LTCRPGELLEPIDFAVKKAEVEKKVGHSISERDVLSATLYPGVFEEFDRHRQEFGDTSVLPTPVFFYGMEVGDEVNIDIEPGKTLIIGLNAVGSLQKDGGRNIYFELNGEPRQVHVPDLSVQSDVASQRKADLANHHEVGAPMPGKVIRIDVKVGDEVKVGDTLLATEAMKMETNIKAKEDGVVKELLCKEGEQVLQGALLIVLE
jgi:pyruvate carboxylase